MPRRLLVFVLFVVGLLVSTIASAATTAYAGTRVGAFDVAVHVGVGLSVDQASEKQSGIGFSCDEIASGSPHAAAGVEAGGIRITQKGLNIATEHLAQFGEHAPNQAMLDRLGSAVGTRVTGADANFYLHEISESTMMGRGMSYDAAHAAALEKYGASPFSLYHPEVIQQFPAEFNNA